MNNMEKNQDNLNKNPQGQGGRTEETREGRDNMRSSGTTGKDSDRNLSARENSEVEEEDDFEDTEEASLDSEEDEEDADFEGTEKSDLGVNNRGRDTNREQSDRI